MAAKKKKKTTEKKTMAKIYIKGEKTENEKVFNILKQNLTHVKKKVTIEESDGPLMILDVYEERFAKDGFSDEEILKALECHTHYPKPLCAYCPYKNEKGCIEKVQIDGALLVNRMHNKVTKNG